MDENKDSGGIGYSSSWIQTNLYQSEQIQDCRHRLVQGWSMSTPYWRFGLQGYGTDLTSILLPTMIIYNSIPEHLPRRCFCSLIQTQTRNTYITKETCLLVVFLLTDGLYKSKYVKMWDRETLKLTDDIYSILSTLYRWKKYFHKICLHSLDIIFLQYYWQDLSW